MVPISGLEHGLKAAIIRAALSLTPFLQLFFGLLGF